MTTVKEYFRHGDKPGDIGMELEVESLNTLPPFAHNIWLAKADGSLRNVGTEYYTRNPIPYDHHLLPRITALTEFLKNPKFGVDYNSTRTSFHVHINVTNHTMIQMWTQVFAYWLLEEPLVNICGKSRCGNQFCLRCKDAEAQVMMVSNILNQPAAHRLFESDNLRYSSQNLKALIQFGSLEYRGMRGTHDPKVLHDWAHGMWYLSQSIKQFDNPIHLFNSFDISDREAFVKRILSPELAAQVLAQGDYHRTTSNGFDMLFDLVYDTDWDALAKSYDDVVSNRVSRTLNVAPAPQVMVENVNVWGANPAVQIMDEAPAGFREIPPAARARRNIWGIR